MKKLIILLLLISFSSYSQENLVKEIKNDIYKSLSTLSISIHNPKSDKSVFFIKNLIVENLELDECLEINNNINLSKSILKLIEEFNLFNEVYVEGENGVVGIKNKKNIKLDDTPLNIYFYYDNTSPVYLCLKNKAQAKRFIFKLIKTIGYKDCLKKLLV